MQFSGINNQPVPSSPGDTPRLTPRQTEILQLATWGLSRKKIARRLGISVRTVEDHFNAMRKRAGVHSGSELIAYAVASGLVASRPRGERQPSHCPATSGRVAGGTCETE